MRGRSKKKVKLTSAATTSITVSSGSDWHQWQGPNRDNISTETGLAQQWPEEGPEMLWAVDCNSIGFGYSSPAITEGRIYITGIVDDQSVLTCLDIDGNQLWQSEYGPLWTRRFPSARCTPAVVNDSVYVISTMGYVGSFNADTGERNWLVNAHEQFEGQTPNWGYAESPLVLNDKVICTIGGNKALMVALDAKDGSVIWTTGANGDKSAFCSPVAFEWAGKTIIATMTANHIMGIEAQNGRVLFSYPIANYVEGRIRGTHPNTPIVNDGKIFVSSGYDMGAIQLKLSVDGTAVEQCWTNPEFDNHHGGIVLVGDKLYGANWLSNRQGNWICVDWETGQTVYEHTWGSKGSLTYAEGMLYCYEESSGMVGLVKANPSGFDVVSTFTVTLGEKEHWAHPVVCGKRLYIRHGKVLMAFDIAASD